MGLVRLLHIYWKNDSPFGTYSDGDKTDVYWDTTNAVFVVDKNGSPITSGGDVPKKFTYGGYPDVLWKEESWYQQSICEGSSLLKFKRNSVFPYITVTRLLEHSVCAIGNVCDLQFNALPKITNASSETSLDGQIEVSAFSSNTELKYKLNGDFEFNDGTAQISGLFAELAHGNYVIFCRDSKNCLAVQSATVGIARTYSTRYQLEIDTLYNGVTVKAEILESDYVGDYDELKGFGANSLTRQILGDGEKDKFIYKLPTVHNLSLASVTEAQYENLYTNDPEKFRIRISIDSGGGYEVKAINKILPMQFEESFESAPYQVSFKAICGLASLDKEPFLDAEGNRLAGIIKQIQVIAFVLNKIGFGINIKSACNIFATGMNSSSSDDPLDQAYVDLSRYYLVREDITCADILRMILEPYGAQIIQWDNAWNILRVEERINEYAYREFDYNGNYLGNGTYDPVVNVKQSSLANSMHWVNEGGTREIVPGFGSIKLLYNMGRKDNLFINGDFTNRRFSVYSQPLDDGTGEVEGNVPDLTGFELMNPDSVVIERTTETVENENIALGFTGVSASAYLLSDNITLKMGNKDAVRIKYNFKIKADALYAPKYCKAKVLVKYGDYWLQDNGSWSTTENYIFIFRSVVDFNKYGEWTLTFGAPTESYINGEDFYIRLYTVSIYDAEFTSLSSLRSKVTIGLPVGYRTELILDGIITYYELKKSGAAESTDFNLNVVRPDDYSGLNPYQWIKVGVVTVVDTQTTSIFIDVIQAEFLNDGKLLPETSGYSQNMENNNNLLLNKVIYHGSIVNNGRAVPDYGLKKVSAGEYLTKDLQVKFINGYTFQLYSYNFTANSAELVYSGHLRDVDGNGFTTWARSAVSESKPIEQIFMDMYSAQYNSSWRRITNSIISKDTLFNPIDCILDFTANSNKKYYPVSLTTDYKLNSHSGEWIEVTDVSDQDGDDTAASFTTGFSLGFQS